MTVGIVFYVQLLRSTLRNPTTYSYLQNLDNTAVRFISLAVEHSDPIVCQIQSLTLQARPNDEFRNKTAALPDTAAEADRFGEDREEEHWFESDDGDEEDEDVGERKVIYMSSEGSILYHICGIRDIIEINL